MKTIELLKPLPIRRDEKRHQYVNIETGQWFSYSTTQVCNELTEEDKQNIEFHRAEWQPRGEKVHECLAEKMLGNKKIDFKEYGEWVEPLEIFITVSVAASFVILVGGSIYPCIVLF